jgi:hypothetical protein
VVDEDGAGFMPANAPCSPSTTERRSSSLPTQQNTMSQSGHRLARRRRRAAEFLAPGQRFSALRL